MSGTTSNVQSSEFGKFLADEAIKTLQKVCTPQWVAQQELRYLQQQERERRKTFKETLTKQRQRLNAISKEESIQTSEIVGKEGIPMGEDEPLKNSPNRSDRSDHSKKAYVATVKDAPAEGI